MISETDKYLLWTFVYKFDKSLLAVIFNGFYTATMNLHAYDIRKAYYK